MNPDPEIETALIVTAPVPVEVTVIGLLTEVPTVTFPKGSDVALRVSAGVVAGESEMVKVATAPPS